MSRLFRGPWSYRGVARTWACTLPFAFAMQSPTVCTVCLGGPLPNECREQFITGMKVHAVHAGIFWWLGDYLRVVPHDIAARTAFVLGIFGATCFCISMYSEAVDSHIFFDFVGIEPEVLSAIGLQFLFMAWVVGMAGFVRGRIE